MGIFGKVKELVGIDEVDEEVTEEDIMAASSHIEKKQIEPKSSYFTPPPATSKTETKEASKLSNQGGNKVNPNTAPFKLVVIEPKAFDECPRLVDNLKAKKPIIINLEKMEADTARKIFDFLSGATYALNGNVQKISNNIFVFAPESVDIKADVEHKGIDFNSSQKNPWR